MVFLNESRCLLLAAIVAIISATQLDASEDKFDREVGIFKLHCKIKKEKKKDFLILI